VKEYLLEIWNTKAGARRFARACLFIGGLGITQLAASGYLGDTKIMSLIGPFLQAAALFIQGGDANPEWLERLNPDKPRV